MSKKIFGGGKKKKEEAPVSALPKPIIAPLSQEEISKRRLLPRPAVDASTSVLGLSGTLGG